MEPSEDQKDEEYAVCVYPKCWIDNCPHLQAREKLSQAEKDVVELKLMKDYMGAGYSIFKSALEKCVEEEKRLT